MSFQKKIYKTRIKELPKQLLPREKALEYGIESLSDVELLALLLGNGTRKLNVLGLADKILDGKGLENIKNITFEALIEKDGIGKAKALQIVAIKEILRRLEEGTESIQFNSPDDVFAFVKWLSKEKQEKMLAIYTNTMNQLLGEEIVAVGGINVVSVKPRDIFIHALKYNAYGIILVHNHPQGTPQPSENDINFTKEIKKLSDTMGFQLLDHIVVGKKGYTSMASMGIV
ncbi:MAG: JAB domain-containing protein [Aquificae bacterium]|nr:JAB domain-containing protein [Aquificota bacterium]